MSDRLMSCDTSSVTQTQRGIYPRSTVRLNESPFNK